MLWLKGCPRCDGPLYDDKDKFGYYVLCMRCGYDLSNAEVAKLLRINHRETEESTALSDENSTSEVPPQPDLLGG